MTSLPISTNEDDYSNATIKDSLHDYEYATGASDFTPIKKYAEMLPSNIFSMNDKYLEY